MTEGRERKRENKVSVRHDINFDIHESKKLFCTNPVHANW